MPLEVRDILVWDSRDMVRIDAKMTVEAIATP
jgi:hypothetical protein